MGKGTKQISSMPGAPEIKPKVFATSIPFDVRLKIAVVKQLSAIITFDPRLEFRDAGVKLIRAEAYRILYSRITMHDMMGLASMIVNKLQDIYNKDGVEVYEQLHLETEPLWEHDCDDCIFLGSHQERDFYFCEQLEMGRPTLISRFGSRGHQYVSGVSGTAFVTHDEGVWCAAVLAEAQGLGSFLTTRHTISIDDYPACGGVS